LAVGTELRVGTLQGLRKYLEIWAKRMKPEYLMASTPAGFTYTDMGWAQGLDVIESPSGIPTSNELIDKVSAPRFSPWPQSLNNASCRLKIRGDH
jgi:hypothetical protein